MSVTLTNQSRTLVTVQLKSGTSVHLAPSETSPSIEDFELRENAQVRQLVDRRVLRVTGPFEETATPAARKARAAGRARTR